MDGTAKKLHKLRESIRSLGSAAVAFSGGADSALLAKVACDELGKKAVAVTIDSPMYPASELKAAKRLSGAIGIEHVIVRVDQLDEKDFISNPPDRCYMCKLGDLKEVRRIADERGLKEVADGTNAEDSRDYRPGLRAKEEMRVRSPLAECGLGKADVRAISKRLKLPTAEKSSSPCLASRIPYGERITPEKLRKIERAEDYLRRKGFEQVRVRLHGDVARIEVSQKDLPRLAGPGTRALVARQLKRIGFAYVTLDLEGYRTGSLNEVLPR